MTVERVDGYLWAEVLRLALHAGDGRVKHTGILSAGCRAALVIDAAERGVITQSDGQLQFDTTVTGAGLVAQLIEECSAHPQRTFAQLLQRGRPHLSAFIAELVDSQVWQRHGLAVGADHAGYRDVSAARIAELQGRLTGSAAQAFIATSTHNAALTAVARVLNLQAGSHRSLNEPDDNVISSCGPLAWIVSDVTTYLLDAQQNDLAAGRSDGLSNSGQLATS